MGFTSKEQKIEATNGHYMYQADFAEFEFMGKKTKAVKGSVIIKPKNKVPASTKKRNIDCVEISTRKEAATIKYLNKFGVIEHMDIGEVIDCKYPDSSRVIKNIKDDEVSLSSPIGFNAKYLSMLSKLMAGNSFPMVGVSTVGHLNAAEFRLKKPVNYNEIFVLMPCKL